MAVELTEAFLAKIAGWEAMKQARSLIERGQVLSSNWTPPILKGVVQEGATSYRAGLVIQDAIDLENICSCRASRQWGTICAHSVAVGLHALKKLIPAEDSRPDLGLRVDAPDPGSPALAGIPVGLLKKAPAKPPSGKRLRRADDSEAGEPLELWIILPPNSAVSLSRGRGMLYFEGQWRGGRAPLNALPLHYRWKLSSQDLRILESIEELAGGETSPMVQVTVTDFCRLLPELAGHPRIRQGKTDQIEVINEPFPLKLEAHLLQAGEIRLTIESRPPVLLTSQFAEAKQDIIWAWHGRVIQPLTPSSAVRALLMGQAQSPSSSGSMVIPRTRVPDFLTRDWPSLRSTSEVRANFRLEDFELVPASPQFHLNLTGGLAQLEAQLQCAYGNRVMTVGITGKDESLWLPDATSITRYSTRDWAAEQAAVGRLVRSGFTGPDVRGLYRLLGQDAVLNFFAREFPRLQREWKVTLEERLERSTSQNLERVEPRFAITPSGEQWFDLSVNYASSSGEQLPPAEIQRLLLSGRNYTRLKNGRMAVIDTGAVEELQEVLLDCAPQQHPGGFRMSNAQAGFLTSTLQQRPEWQVHAPADWRERAAKQSGAVPLGPPPLGDLEPVLRPYQKQGVAWLRFLRENQFGGILADEMGLGKTLQTLAFIRSVIHAENPNRAGRWPVLVVCPTSLVFNWAAEAARFTPELRVVALHGPTRRTLFDQIRDSDIVVTTYALIRRDADRYRGFEFDTVVLDEAQHIKNRQTQNAQAVKAIRARHRIVLTGTPLENSVLDLWSIFDFLMPGYLGSAKDFRERYELPIARERNPDAQARLARRVRPFLLRRLKREVATDLPEKIEQVTFCELTGAQRTVYQQILEMGRREVLESVGAQGLGKSRMVIFNALLRLRQICCDLRLLKLEDVKPETASAKLELLDELLQEALDGGHRVLVFSQFVTMLQLIRQQLDSGGIEYCYLDGATTERGEVVNRFQNHSSIPVFLISLKAGGVGLNLSAADTVIHFDPWWNPAVEDQATDRAHRIGQTRIVTSYKLITRDTVEEKILSLQNRKRAVTAGLLDSDEQLSEALSWEEIQELFEI